MKSLSFHRNPYTRSSIIACALFGLVMAVSHAEESKPSCQQTAGEEKATEYVNQCIRVSPATHPPCNANNSCEMIIDEIKRGCALIGYNDPACKPYKPRRSKKALAK